MQGNNGQQGNQGAGQKSGGLSWSQSAPQNQGSTSSAPAAKPAQAAVPPMPSKVAVPPPAKSGNSAAPQKQPGGSRLVGIFISGVIVGLIIGWGWFSLRTDNTASITASTTKQGAVVTPSKTNTDTTPKATTPAAGTVSNGTLSVSSLQGAGLSVAVSNISVAVPTWVVIMDNNNGVPGNALGAQMFFPGEKSGSIDLLRATVSGKSYLVAEYVDDGDHKFSKQMDAQVTGISGAPTLVEFTVR